MTIFFIPGFGEEVSIFNNIQTHIKGEKVFIDNWIYLKDLPEVGLDAKLYAEFLIKLFSIKKEDVVIGHSMGGWVALQIKQIVGCAVIQISSWSNPKKLIYIPLPRFVIYYLCRKGWVFNDLSLKFVITVNYKNKPSQHIVTQVFRKLQAGNKVIVSKQARVSFEPLKEVISARPDVRIHGMEDKIVKCPDEPFVKTRGDHFALVTYPEDVYNAIISFLAQ